MAQSAGDLLIWWTDQRDCEAIGSALGAGNFPPYLREQYRSRLGRNGRGRLWTDSQFGNVAVEPWPHTPFAAALGAGYAGIVIRAGDARHLNDLPGIITDLALRRTPTAP